MHNEKAKLNGYIFEIQNISQCIARFSKRGSSYDQNYVRSHPDVKFTLIGREATFELNSIRYFEFEKFEKYGEIIGKCRVGFRRFR